jgi:hypothetical protein
MTMPLAQNGDRSQAWWRQPSATLRPSITWMASA